MELLEDYGLKSYPMSVGRVAEALGIEVIQYSRLPKQAQESALTVSDDAFTVSTSDYATARMAVNDMRGSHHYRARFSGGHEIGHIYLGHGEDTPKREEEADYFSGYLLAPHPLIIARCGSFPVSDVFGISAKCAHRAMHQAAARQEEGGARRCHEQWLLENVAWEGGGFVGRA